MQFSSWLLSGLLLVAGPATALAGDTPKKLARPAVAPPTLAAEFVQACNQRLDLTDAQRTSLRTYLEQEIDYMNVQVANHSAAEVAELIPAERAQLQAVAGHLLSPGQLRQFRELEATPPMKAYLKQMSLGE
jgi:hypothetical protein